MGAKLNPEQLKAVEYGEGPLMVLAGAGSGKTRVLVHRIARLVEKGVRPHRILAVTFTNKAAGEMRERLEGMMGYRAGSMWISTFHSTCARLLRLYHGAVGLSRDFAIYDDDDQKKILQAILKEEGLDDSMTPRSCAVLIDRAKNRGEDPCESFHGNYADDIIRQVYPRYQERLAREDAVDFNDLLLKVRDMAKHEVVGPELAGMFDHVLVDEFQDTNLVQFALVKHWVSQTGNLTVVGDDDQSIYSWRGAEPRNLLDFDRAYPRATAIKLEQNYRSSAMILRAANGIIQNNFDRHEKALWTDRDPGEPVLWEESSDERGEASFIAAAIHGLQQEEQRELGDIAILYRTHAQSRVLEETLRQENISYRIVGGVSFFQRKEIKDIRGYLRLVINPQADLAFERIVNTPTRGIGKTTVERLKAFARKTGISMLEAARAAGRGQVPAIKGAAAKKVMAFVTIIDGLVEVVTAGASVAEIIIQTVERSGYRDRLEKEDTPESRDRLQNLSELVSMATDYDDEADGASSLVEFEERISLASTADAEHGGSSVTMMTIHAAKGLEFPVVFVAGMEDGLFPSLRERDYDSKDSLEEERRLAYVAFTRAMDRLVLTSTRTRRVWNEIRLNHPSRFLDEIPEDCMAVRARPQGSYQDDSGFEADFQPDFDFEQPVPARQDRKRSKQKRVEVDEFDQRTHWDDVPHFDVGGDEPAASVGSWVEHSSFGPGKVLETRGEGNDRKLLINFQSVGLKTVLARFVEPGL
ncbi:MAG: UvrD-helicase domain-containing protein [Deltaproteobacteria bacterium]|nr:UvrD-helicase domain-containing protein [Deltaproteobacteria bacterium]